MSGTGSATITYRCAICGQWHDGIPDLAFRLPLHIDALAEDDRRERARISDDLCSLDDEHFFVRCLIEIPIVDHQGKFAYGVWSSLSKTNFDFYVATFDDARQSHVGPFFGWLCNRLPGYPDTLHLKCSVQPRDGGLRPAIMLQATDHPLSCEQHEGMTLDRVTEILSLVVHQRPLG